MDMGLQVLGLQIHDRMPVKFLLFAKDHFVEPHMTPSNV